MAFVCELCGSKDNITYVDWKKNGKGQLVCDACRFARYEKQEREHKAKVEQLTAAAAKVILSTTPSLDGYWITDYLGVGVCEHVMSNGLLPELWALVLQIFGLRYEGFEHKLAVAREEAATRLRMLAAQKGANAVVGFDLDYTEFFWGRIGVVASGTLVKVEKAGG